jgi:hypothetical protein
MCETGCACERRLSGDATERIAKALHDLCQPLTTLHCRLELAGLNGTVEGYREAVQLGLAECARMVEAVGSLREIVQAAREDEAVAMEARR